MFELFYLAWLFATHKWENDDKIEEIDDEKKL